MPFKRLPARLVHFLFILFFARRMAAKLRQHLPLLGMTEGQTLVLGSPSKTCGQSFLSGFTTPELRCGMFLKKRDGWHTNEYTIFVTPQATLMTREKDEWNSLSFWDPRALPLIELLKTILFSWPFTIYMVSTKEQIESRRPKLKG